MEGPLPKDMNRRSYRWMFTVQITRIWEYRSKDFAELYELDFVVLPLLPAPHNTVLSLLWSRTNGQVIPKVHLIIHVESMNLPHLYVYLWKKYHIELCN